MRSPNDKCVLPGSIECFGERASPTVRYNRGNRYRSENASLRRFRPCNFAFGSIVSGYASRDHVRCQIREPINITNLTVVRYSVRSQRSSTSLTRRNVRNIAHLHFSNFTRSERDISWRATKKNISGECIWSFYDGARNMDEYFFTEIKGRSSFWQS